MDSRGVRQYVNRQDPDVPATTAGTIEEQMNPRLCTTGLEPTAPEPLAIVCWQDARDDPSVPMYDIYAQVIDTAGNCRGGTDGIDICVEREASQENPVMTVWERPEISPAQDYIPYAVIAWEDTRSGTRRDVYANLLDALNLATIGPQGDTVCIVGNEKTELSIDHRPYDDRAEVYLAWRHEPVGGQGAEADIFYDRITVPSWTKQYAPCGFAVTEAKGVQRLPQVSGDVFVYEDARRKPIAHDGTDDWNIYCQRPGECVGPTGMGYRDMFVRWGEGTSEAHARHVNDPEDHSVFVVWDEERDGVRSVFAQKLDKDGVPRWENNGVRVSGEGETAQNPDVAINRGGGAWVVWEQATGQGTRIFYAELDSMGQLKNPPSSIGGGRSGDDKSPRVIDIDNANCPNLSDRCIIAFLNNGTTGDWKRYVAGDSTSATVILNMAVLSHDSLLLERDYSCGCYLMTWGKDAHDTVRINVAHVRFNGSSWSADTLRDQNEKSILSSSSEMGGYDLCADVFPSGGNAAHHLMIAYSTRNPGMGMDIFVQRYDPLNMNLSGPGIPIYATIHVDDDHFNPAVTPDSTSFGNGFGGGFLLTWNTGYYPQPGIRRHRVATTRIGWYAVSIPYIPLIFFTVSSELPEQTRPDIARPSNWAPGLPLRSFIVWEGGYETSPCTPPRPREIYAQYADYSTYWPLWQSDEMVSPGGGDYMQVRPTVSASDGHSVYCSWVDGRTGTWGVMGTRLTDASGTIGWCKTPVIRRTRPRESVSLASSVYPNPVTDLSGAVTIGFSSERECDMEIVVYDVLGRIVMEALKRVAVRGGNAFSMRLPASCPAGTYFVQLRAAERMEIIPVAVVR
ncbi:MAG: T9SS type A sorting domain-containing protein [Bacteroidota bacterium]|nr:T9SS type A sorting domain-containing protein [Bacteroidota bacterium]